MPSKLFISVYKDVARDSTNQPILAPQAPPIAESYLEITPENNVSEPMPGHARFIGLKADADCCLAFGSSPVAKQDYHFMEAGELRYYGCVQGMRVAVIGVVQ
jgi:hypothetical protein